MTAGGLMDSMGSKWPKIEVIDEIGLKLEKQSE